ncbi:MAG: trimethylamine methyltransferase family protein [Alphaproteobacteria bacterium]|nr:trimethylamine methyltransferase family protein [Alphaproteobacteria bacterium]
MHDLNTDPSPGSAAVRRGRRGGRSARVARNAARDAVPRCAVITRKAPVYDLLGEEALQRIEAHADWILREIGIEFRGDEEALRLFKDAGATVTGERVRFDAGLARTLCSSAPKSFRMEGRDSASSITLGGDHVVFMPAYGPPFVTDLEHGRRYATIEDFRNFVKLAYASPWLHHSGGTVCEPVDVPANKRHLDMVYAHLRFSTKPFMGSVTAPERAADSIAMARLVFGDACLEENCVIQGNINVNSPLVYDHVMSGALKVYARANQSVVVSPFILGGAMGPVTQPALLAQAHAEAMAGIALSQLVRRGAPVVYGNFLSTMNLKTGAPTFGTPEANLSTFAIAQLCRRLGLPLRCGGHLTASKVADGQAMQESVASMMAGILAGSNFVFHAAGWLEGGLTMGYEKFVMDLDHCAMMHRMMAGLTVDSNELAADAYREAGPGETFLGTAHTLAHFETANCISELADTTPYEQWVENGRHDLERRAHGRWKDMLAAYQAPALDPATDEALQDFMARRKSALPDQWH